MITAEDLSAFARELCDQGLQAYELGVPIPGKGTQLGVMIVGVGFFPLWELSDPANVALIIGGEFAAIKAARPANWEMVEPRLWDEEPKGE